jgi:hypothetical protein
MAVGDACGGDLVEEAVTDDELFAFCLANAVLRSLDAFLEPEIFACVRNLHSPEARVEGKHGSGRLELRPQRGLPYTAKT